MIKYVSYYLNNTLLKVRQVFFIELENITAAIADSNPIELMANLGVKLPDPSLN